MPAPKPDTSPANVARVLRKEAKHRDTVAQEDLAQGYDVSGDAQMSRARELRALADALDQQAEPLIPEAAALLKQEERRYLDQQAAAPTWEERVERALSTTNISGDISGYDGADAALRAAFPEYAPND